MLNDTSPSCLHPKKTQEFILTLLDKLNTEMATITHQPVFTDIASLPVGSHPSTPLNSNSMASTPRLRARAAHRRSDSKDSVGSSAPTDARSSNGYPGGAAPARLNGLPGGATEVPAVEDVLEHEDAQDQDQGDGAGRGHLPRFLFSEKSKCQASARVLRYVGAYLFVSPCGGVSLPHATRLGVIICL